LCFFFQAEDGIRYLIVTGVQTCALPICPSGFIERFRTRHNLQVRYMPPNVMLGSLRRLDLHRRQLLIEDSLDSASLKFELARQRSEERRVGKESRCRGGAGEWKREERRG